MSRGERDRKLTGRVERWFHEHGRDLPWRAKRDPYACLVAEFMLQQTQVSRVVERFGDFMARFPTVGDLARADEQAVLALWQGLGYYRRARFLHRAAQVIVEEHGGEVPDDVSRLRALPGVGRYMAGSLASIVFGRRAPLVDGNVKRVLARWFAYDEPIDTGEAERWFWDVAERLVEASEEPGVFNEGLMELGATVCTPKRPACETCPVATLCLAKRNGLVDSIPVPKTAPSRETLHHHALVIESGGRVLLEQRPAAGLWAGMWQPPTIESRGKSHPADIIKRAPFTLTAVESIGHLQRTLTHREVHFHIYRARTSKRSGHWQRLDEIDAIPMSNAHRRVLEIGLGERIGD